MASRHKKPRQQQWYKMDLHLHTPGSADYQEPHVTYLDILRKAEFRGLDIIAFTDHNTVAGYAGMLDEIEKLSFLETLGRAQPEESRRLAEYRRLLDKILVLPGFEFTATFGFHILGIFAPQTPIRQIEHLLLSLNVPAAALDAGNSEVGASADVLTAYQGIYEAGGICIAAHVNSTHGVAMKGFDFGGQTRIAYTQDRHLHALEVTDLGRKTRDATERFFNGTKPGYPRRMRCIQGSDAHRINAPLGDRTHKNANLGVGDRMTEVQLIERSFESLLEMFQGTDFSRTRPYNSDRTPLDYIQAARDEGNTLVQAIHEGMNKSGGRLFGVLTDVCAFANTNGGTIYIGLPPDPKQPAIGVEKPQDALNLLQREIARMITPRLECEIDVLESGGKPIIRVQVPSGAERPYAIEDNKIYVRDEGETSLAIRDEIVNLVRQNLSLPAVPEPVMPVTLAPMNAAPSPAPQPEPTPTAYASDSVDGTPAPTAGVEIAAVEERDDTRYYTMRDLRNGSLVQNVTRSSARRLWHYAIKQAEGNPIRPDKVQWHGEIGVWQRYDRNGQVQFDLVQRSAGGGLRVYYGVSDSGMTGSWAGFLSEEE